MSAIERMVETLRRQCSHPRPSGPANPRWKLEEASVVPFRTMVVYRTQSHRLKRHHSPALPQLRRLNAEHALPLCISMGPRTLHQENLVPKQTVFGRLIRWPKLDCKVFWRASLPRDLRAPSKPASPLLAPTSTIHSLALKMRERQDRGQNS